MRSSAGAAGMMSGCAPISGGSEGQFVEKQKRDGQLTGQGIAPPKLLTSSPNSPSAFKVMLVGGVVVGEGSSSIIGCPIADGRNRGPALAFRQ